MLPKRTRGMSRLLATALAIVMVSTTVGLALGTTSASGLSAGTALLKNCGQSRIPLGAAGNFRVLAATTITNTGATSVSGNIGLSPGSSIPGVPPGKVSGQIFAADKAAANGQQGLLTAYQNGMSRSHCATLVAGNLGGRTLGPGLYDSTSSLAISSGDLTLNAHGDRGAVFIFQIASKFTMTSGRQVILSGGARAANVFWVVGSSATIGTTAVLYGIILAHTSISLATHSTLYGRALARIGAVTLEANTIRK